MKHVVCFSGGHSSAIVAIEVVRKFGKDATILLNHDINEEKELPDIKRFKQEVVDYLGLPITYANIAGISDPAKIPNQFEVCIEAKAFKVDVHPLCTNRLKTRPFEQWLAGNAKKGSTTIYYGFDGKEKVRVIRRRKIIEAMGYLMDAPLAEWDRKERTIRSTTEIGIEPPNTYSTFKHANCIGCLRARKQHWYAVFCLYPSVFGEAVVAESIIGHSILPDGYLKDFVDLFLEMKEAGVHPTEHVQASRFWAEAKKTVALHKAGQLSIFNLMGEFGGNDKPCECIV